MTLIHNIFTPQHLIIFVYILNAIIALGLIFFDNKTPTATLAWIMVMFLLPVFGLILYLVFSQNIARKKIYKITEETLAAGSFLLQKQKDGFETFMTNCNNNILKKWKEMVWMNIEYGNSMLTFNKSIDITSDGIEMFDRLCDDIENAKYSIKVEYFILKDDLIGRRFISLLTKKAKEGLKVRLLMDAMGSKSISEADLMEFKKYGGEYAFFFKPRIRKLFIRFNYRNHRKLVIIDNEIGYIGGFNIAKEYLGYKKKFGKWRDAQFFIRGNSLFAINEQFYLDWFCAKNNEDSFNFIEHSFKYSYSEDSGDIPVQIVSSGPNSEREEIKRTFMKMITKAEKNIYIQTPYLVPDDPMLESLSMAARSGVDVKIMIPCKPDHPFVYRTTLYNAGKLINEGVKIFIYNDGFLHAKTISVDGEVCAVGSANFDIRSFKLNFESDAVVYDANITEKLDKEFYGNLEQCTEYTAKDRAEITKKEKFLESISRLLQEIL